MGGGGEEEVGEKRQFGGIFLRGWTGGPAGERKGVNKEEEEERVGSVRVRWRMRGEETNIRKCLNVEAVFLGGSGFGKGWKGEEAERGGREGHCGERKLICGGV